MNRVVGIESQDRLLGRNLGDFVLVERIGEGGFGAVYRAKQPLLDREAVVKVLHTRLRAAKPVTERFLREARLASKLDHPYAAHIYAFGAEPDGELWIAMELVRGTPLDQVLRIQGPLPLERFVPLLDRICEVVHTAHEQGIVHRDLKPANVMVLSRAGRLLPKLLDFGIAKALAQAPSAEGLADTLPEEKAIDAASVSTPETAGLTQRGAIMGSPPYMAPEQWLDAGNVDARTDLYALGVLAYEALTGRQPFTGRTVTAIAAAHARSAPPPLGPQFPAALDEVFARVLAKKAAERTASALELAEAFRRASGVQAEPARLPELDEAAREAALSGAPQPIAEAVAALEAARNAHQARDAMWLLVRTVVRYLGLLAIACRSRVSGRDAEPLAVSEALRALHRRTLTDEEWLALARELAHGFAARRDAYPVPELVDLFFLPGGDRPADPGRRLEALAAMRGGADGTQREADLLSLLERAARELSRLLAELAWLGDYALVVSVGPGVAERWMGVRRSQRGTVAVRGHALPSGEPALLDKDGVPVLSLAPLFQVAPPTPGAPLELFLFDGRGRHGAKLGALPSGFERHDDALWDWFRAQLSGSLDEAQAAAAEERPPYRGLSTFSAEDAALFFGREKLVDAFLNRLRMQPLLAVVGRSGAGKSSFVQAGVLPALPADWRVVTLRPGPAPLPTLRARLERAELDADALRAEAAARGPLLLVVDQLEEIFTLCHDAEERQRFADVVAGLARSADDPIRVIVTLRDDFLVRAEQVPALQTRLGQGLQLLTVPAEADLLRILIEPARRVGYEFEDQELPAEMVRDVADQPGALALLSFTASKLWELRDRHFKQLTRKAYRSLGGVGGALAQHAEGTLAEMPPEERRLTREAFRHLVTSQGTRAVLMRKELRQLLGGGAHADAVIEKLVTARLLVASEDESGEDLIEIVHEALLTAWPRLVEWRREDAEGARLRDQLRAAARQWEERGRPGGLLWRDEALADYQRWRTRHAVALTESEAAFAEASVRDAVRGKRVRTGLVAATITILAAGLLVLSSLNATKEQERRRAEAQVAELREEHGRQLFLAGDPIRAVLYLDAARRAGADDPALRYLFSRATAILGKHRLGLAGFQGTTYAGRYSPDGRRIVAVGDDGMARAWDAETGALVHELAGHADLVVSLDFSPDGRRLITAGADDKTARIWTDDGRLLHTLEGHQEWVIDVRMSPDGRRAVSTSVDGTARVWDVESGALVTTLTGHQGAVNDACFTRDGSVFTVGEDHTVALWDGATGARRSVGRVHKEQVNKITLSPTGALVATAGMDGTIVLWDAADGHLVRVLDQARIAPPTRPAFSPDGALLATKALADVQVWDVASGQRRASLVGHAGEIQSIAFSPDGARIATSSQDGTVRLWDAVTGQPLALVPSVDAIQWVSFSRDGAEVALGGGAGVSVWSAANDGRTRVLEGMGTPAWTVRFDPSDPTRLIAGGGDGAVRSWDLDQAGPPAAFAGHRKEVRAAAFSPDGARILTADETGTVQIWDAERREVLARFASSAKGEVSAVWTDFSPNGERAVTAHGDRTARIWNTRTGELVRVLEGHDDYVYAAAWRPDGAMIGTCSADRTARLWDPETGTMIRTLSHDEWCPSIAFSPGSDRVITATQKVARVWNVATGELEVTLEGHQHRVNYAAFGPDGLVVTTSVDKTARIWDGHSGRLLDTLSHPASVEQADFSPDGRSLATVAGELVYVWTLPRPLSDDRARQVVESQPFELKNGVLFPKGMH